MTLEGVELVIWKVLVGFFFVVETGSVKKPEEVTQEEKDDMANTEKAVTEQKEKKRQIIADAAKGNDIIHQLIDLALLQNGMLKGEALDRFLKRSVDLIKTTEKA